MLNKSLKHRLKNIGLKNYSRLKKKKLIFIFNQASSEPLYIVNSRHVSIRYMRTMAKKIGLKRYTLMSKTELRETLRSILTDPNYIYHVNNFTVEGLRERALMLGLSTVGDKMILTENINRVVIGNPVEYTELWNNYLRV